MSPATPPTANPAATPASERSTQAVLREVTPVDLSRLQCLNGYPMVSVLMATAPGARLDSAETTRLEHLIDIAERRLAAELPAAEMEEVMGPLRHLVSRIVSRSSTSLGLALFSGAGVAEAYRLPLAPVERVVIDPTFATRDLAHSVLDNPPFRLLTLASGTAQLYFGPSSHLCESVDRGFPIDSRAAASPADRRGHLHQGERTHKASGRWDSFLRDVDHALTADHRTRSLPLILAAAEPLASRYRARTSHNVIGTVPGNHQRTTRARLTELARPVIERHVADQRRDALDELDQAINRCRAASDINEVWNAAHGGRVALLLVDPDYAYPALPAPDGRSLTPSSNREHPGVIDDAVDEVIEAVARRGGRICFSQLPPAHGGIAAVLGTT